MYSAIGLDLGFREYAVGLNLGYWKCALGLNLGSESGLGLVLVGKKLCYYGLL